MSRIAIKLLSLAVLSCLLTACALKDAQTAKTAQRTLIGWSELDLETCLGAPDQRSTLGDTDILTYYGNSTSNRSFSVGLPFLGGFNLAGGGGGYCHATFRVKDGRLAEVRYSGETNATLAPDAYCAPIVRGCVQHPEHLQASPPATSEAPSRDATDAWR
jgi:hypothetical protein